MTRLSDLQLVAELAAMGICLTVQGERVRWVYHGVEIDGEITGAIVERTESLKRFLRHCTTCELHPGPKPGKKK